MQRDPFVRLVKKEYILFKKDRSERHRYFNSEIKSVLKGGDYYFVESEILQAFHLKALYEGVGSSIHHNYNKCESIELDATGCQTLTGIESIDMNYANDWLCVFPAEWQVCGGFLVRSEVFFLNFSGLSYLMEDDFSIYDGSLGNALLFKGDRSAEALNLCDVTTRGDYFSFFTRIFNKP